jgi:hypothetical protein
MLTEFIITQPPIREMDDMEASLITQIERFSNIGSGLQAG